MTIHKDQSNQIQYGVAGPGANPEDTCSLENMQVKARYPYKHGSNVLDEHLGFSNVVVPVGQQHVLAPVFDEGSTIAAMQSAAYPGTNLSLVCGTIPMVGDMNGATPGNQVFNHIFQKRKTGAGTKVPPQSKRNGSVYEIVEKGVQHSLSLLDGLPSHGALNMLAGMKHDALKSVATAKQQFEAILTGDMLSQLPGQGFNLGGLLDNLNSGQLKTLFENMPDNVQAGLKNAMTLMQTSTSSDSGGFMTNNRINPDVFFENAVNELKDVKTVAELDQKLQKLMGDESLKGLDQLGDTLIEIEGAFGNVTAQITATGGISLDLSKVQGLLQGFADKMGQLPGAGGQSGGMFNGSELKNIFNRLNTTEQKQFKKLVENHVDSGQQPRALLNSMLAKVLDNKQFPMR